MPLAKNAHAYADIKHVLEQSRAMGGAVLELPNFAAAVQWCARAYMYRKLLRATSPGIQLQGYIPSTPWDDMIIRRDNKNKTGQVRIEFGVLLPGELHPLTDPSPKLVPTRIEPEVDDDLMQTAMRLLSGGEL